MAGRHRAASPTWGRRLAAHSPTRPLATARARAKPALAAGLSGVLMVGLCAATLSSPAAEVEARPAVPELSAALPLRTAEDRASRDTTRVAQDGGATNDLTVEAEASASATRLALQRVQQRQQADDKATLTAAVEQARPSGGTPAENRELGRFMTLEYGWGAEQFSCLDRIWSQESNWTTTAENSSSGAYGIPQSLPGTKMATIAPDWRTNPETQIAWGLGYIDDRYGTPCSAWSFKQGTGWY